MKSVMKVYSAEKIDSTSGLTELKVNIPELFPMLMKDDKETILSIRKDYFLNTNYPPVSSSIKMANYVKLKISPGVKLPAKIVKGQPFLMLSPNERVEDSILINI